MYSFSGDLIAKIGRESILWVYLDDSLGLQG